MDSKRIIVAIGGAKGVGKTEVIKKIADVLDGFVIIRTGKILQKMSLKRFDKDFISLDKSHKNTIRKQYTQKILQINKNLLLDAHFGEFEDGGYPCVIPKKLLKYITHFALITSDSQQIQKRRNIDGKSRRLDTTSIQLNLLGEKLLFKKLIHNQNAKGLSVVNKNIDQVAKSITKFIKS